jgi:hypothetical protein
LLPEVPQVPIVPLFLAFLLPKTTFVYTVEVLVNSYFKLNIAIDECWWGANNSIQNLDVSKFMLALVPANGFIEIFLLSAVG